MLARLVHRLDSLATITAALIVTGAAAYLLPPPASTIVHNVTGAACALYIVVWPIIIAPTHALTHRTSCPDDPLRTAARDRAWLHLYHHAGALLFSRRWLPRLTRAAMIAFLLCVAVLMTGPWACTPLLLGINLREQVRSRHTINSAWCRYCARGYGGGWGYGGGGEPHPTPPPPTPPASTPRQQPLVNA